jgi:TPR repeat protein
MRKLEKAAQAGDSVAVNELGLYLFRQGKRQQAVDLLLPAASRGDQTALLNLTTLAQVQEPGKGLDLVLLFRIGTLFIARDDVEQGGHWLRVVGANGDSVTVVNVSRICSAIGWRDEADAWIERAEQIAGLDAEWLAEREARAGNGESDPMFELGLRAHRLGHHGVAESWWRRAAGTGHVFAAERLGVLLQERGDRSGAEEWFGQAAAAMWENGAALLQDGLGARASIWLERAAVLGHLSAMRLLAELMRRRLHRADAEDWLRKAGEAGDVLAMTELAFLLESGRRDAEAEEWYRRAIERDPRAIAGLALFLARLERFTEAEDVLGHPGGRGETCVEYASVEVMLAQGRPDADRRRPGGDGETAAAFALLLEQRGDYDRALEWCRRAADLGRSSERGRKALMELSIAHTVARSQNVGKHSHASVNLVGREQQALSDMYIHAGTMKLHEAERDLAVEEADAEPATRNARVAEADQRLREQTEAVYRSVSAADSFTIRTVFTSVLWEELDRDEAERWWRRAADADDTGAMNVLGQLARHRERPDEAEEWWRRAAEAGDGRAKILLGDTAEEQGRRLEAAQLYREAVGLGATEALDKLIILLIDLCRWDEVPKWEAARPSG